MPKTLVAIVREHLTALKSGATVEIVSPCPSCSITVTLVCRYRGGEDGLDLDIYHKDPSCELATSGGLPPWVKSQFFGVS